MGNLPQFSLISDLNVFAGEITALKDIWFIGDNFVNDTCHTVQAIQATAKGNIKKGMFIYKEYNVKCFTSRPTTTVYNTAAQGSE